MRPKEHALAGGGEVADRGDQMGRPDPGGRKEHHAADSVVVFHLLERGAGLLLRGQDRVMLEQLQALVRSVCFARATIASSMNGWPMGSSSPSL